MLPEQLFLLMECTQVNALSHPIPPPASLPCPARGTLGASPFQTRKLAMAVKYILRLPEPSRARGTEPSLSFTSDGAGGLAAELQAALREDTLFQRWRAMQEDPDEVDPALGATDPAAAVFVFSDSL